MNVIDRDVVKTELTRLKKQHGFLTPELVLDEAKNPNSPLHDSAGFEWDTDAAAERHWLHHARILIKTIRIQITVENTVYEHPKFVRHPAAPSKAPMYVEVDDIKQEHMEYEFLTAEFSRIEAQVKRAQHYAIALGFATDYNRLLTQLQAFQLKLQARRPKRLVGKR